MKKVIVALLLVASLGVSSLPISVEAATRAEMLQQIETLTNLISLLQMQLDLKRQQERTEVAGTLTYTRKSGYLDNDINRYGVDLLYSTSPQCNSLTTSDTFRVDFGDGESAPADCKGVADHVYDKDGIYTAKYLRNGVTIAKTQVAVNGDDMQLFLKNISNPTTKVFKNGVVDAFHGDRIGVGWNNSNLKNCRLKDLDEDLEEKYYYKGSSEIETGVAVHMPRGNTPSQIYKITVQCSLNGKTVSDVVRVNYDDPFYERDQEINKIDWSKQLQGLLREKPEVGGSLSVRQINSTAMELSGSITPHDDCVGTENMEIILDYGNNKSESFSLEKCESISFKETIIYTPSLIPVFPTLKLKWEDWNNNVWQYSELSRYKIDLSNPLNPTITNLGINGKKG